MLIFNPESKVTYGMVCWMMNVGNVKQCDTPESNNTHASIEQPKIPATTSLYARDSSVVKVLSLILSMP